MGRLYHKSNRRQIAKGMLCMLALGLILGACGKKPGHIDPPPDVTEDKFPQTYPDTSTDPKPPQPDSQQ